MTVLVSGATGFIGANLIRINGSVGVDVLPADIRLGNNSCFDPRLVKHLSHARTVIHLAGLAHGEYAQAELDSVNFNGCLAFAKLSAEAGVTTFIYISSINVYRGAEIKFFTGDEDESDLDFQNARTKAEFALRKLSADTGMNVVIIRSPLVYGPGVKANFLSLLRLSATPFPLPFARVNNRRSMVYVGNLVDFIIRCIDHPKAANQTFLVSDGYDISLSDLIRMIRRAMNRPAWLIPMPVSLFKLAGQLTGKMELVDRLVGDLQVDSRKARELLDWTPPYTVEQGIAATVAEFINRKT